MSYTPNGSDTGEMSRLVFRASWGEEVSSPRVRLTPDYRSSSPRHPYSTLFNFSFSVCFAIDYVFQYNYGAHPLATGRHSGMPEAPKYSCLPQLRVITHGAIPPMRARRLTPVLNFRIRNPFSCFSSLFDFSFLY